jgi:drug/metabolite transporter (DMT)-like permease
MPETSRTSAFTGTRAYAFLLLALSNLFWGSNWVIGRALRDAFGPVALNFWRWAVAVLILAPFALPGFIANRDVIRRNWGMLLLLSLASVVLFQSMVYLGLRTTTAVNAVLLNSSGPLFMLLCSWAIERERATLRQVAGMLISLAGILVILTRGDVSALRQFELHAGDAWILLAMPMWGTYSVFLRRRPVELGGVVFVFVMAVFGLAVLAPLYALEALVIPAHWPNAQEAAAILYIGVTASAAAHLCWNRGVAIVGPNAAGFTLHLLPAFGTGLAMLFLAESFHAFHAAGVATIIAGVLVATRAGGKA